MTPSSDDYDTPWKDALTRYFPEFMSFYFPAAHADIDWESPCEFLEQELAQVTRDAELGLRRVDKLVRIALRGGAEQWVFVHIDVQGSRDNDFAERVFVYNYRIYDRYRRPVASLAVLADSSVTWKPESFGYKLFGCEVGIHFPIVKLNDYSGQMPSLLQDKNPFALVTAAHLLTQQTRGHKVERYEAKGQLARLLHERNWDRQRIIDLFNIIDWMMHIPDDLQSKLLDEIGEFERNHAMPYISSFEQRGLERGRQEGRQEGQSELLSSLLTMRFGRLPEPIQARLATASPDELKAWGVALLDAPTLDSVFVKR
jgi:hypothetical protein